MQVRPRIVVDCWVAGCGWSTIGWESGSLLKEWEDHAKEKHGFDDQQP